MTDEELVAETVKKARELGFAGPRLGRAASNLTGNYSKSGLGLLARPSAPA